MIRRLAILSSVILLMCLSGLGLIHTLAQQPHWNALMFTYEWSPNMIDRDGSRTWMIDLNTGMRHKLPFRYFDRATVEISADGNRVLMTMQDSETQVPGVRGGDLIILNRNKFSQTPYLTDYIGYDGEPDAVADLRQIVFVSDRDSFRDLYTMLLDSEDRPTLIRRITFDDLVESNPQWLTREQYHDYLGQFRLSRDSVILNPDEDNLFFDD